MTSTHSTAPHRGRRLLAGLSAIALAAFLSGCAIFSPQATEEVYNPGDGSNLDLGGVQVRDLLVVGTAEDEPATVIGYVVNNTSDPVTVTFSSEGGSARATIPPGEGQQVSPPGSAGVRLDTLGVAPGAILDLSIVVGTDPPATVGVQTITPDNPLYADYRAEG